MKIESSTFALPQLLSLPTRAIDRLMRDAKEANAPKTVGTTIPFGNTSTHVGISYDPSHDTLTVEIT